MGFESKIALITGFSSFTFMLNLPFGYLRAKTKRLSFNWFLYIHIPIPLVILGRILLNIDFNYIPILVFAAIIGQICGGKLEFKP